LLHNDLRVEVGWVRWLDRDEDVPLLEGFDDAIEADAPAWGGGGHDDEGGVASAIQGERRAGVGRGSDFWYRVSGGTTDLNEEGKEGRDGREGGRRASSSCLGGVCGVHDVEILSVTRHLKNRSSVAACVLAATLMASCQPIEHATRSIEESFTPKSYGPPPLVVKDEPELRVRILKDAQRIVLDGPTRVVVRTNQGAAPVSIACPIVVTSSNQGLTVRDGRGQTKTWGYGTDVEIVASDGRGASGASLGTAMLRINEVSFQGFVSIRPRWQDYPSQFDVIASMGVEGYLPGALGEEINTTWPRQALEAQAVVTRTLALGDMETARRSGRQFDVESSLDRQRAMTGEGTTRAMEAVRQTRGMVLTSGGRLLKAYYSSTCGGRPASAVDVWGSTYGTEYNRAEPLFAKAREFSCDRSPNFRWEVERRDEELSQRFRAWGVAYTSAVSSMARVREIRVEQTNAAKRPAKYRIIDNGGREFVISAEEFRAACNHPIVGQPPVDDSTRVRSGDVEIEIWANIVKFRGRGFGHGVGMCQQCARGFADQGWDWRRMMTQFYPGAELTKMY
jgi:stage II sporulation protein D